MEIKWKHETRVIDASVNNGSPPCWIWYLRIYPDPDRPDCRYDASCGNADTKELADANASLAYRNYMIALSKFAEDERRKEDLRLGGITSR